MKLTTIVLCFVLCCLVSIAQRCEAGGKKKHCHRFISKGHPHSTVKGHGDDDPVPVDSPSPTLTTTDSELPQPKITAEALVDESTPLPPIECTSVAETAATTDGLSTVVAAIQAAGLEEALGADFVGTVFAPTNEAFDALLAELNISPTDLLDDLDLLNAVLALHVVPDVAARAEDLSDGDELVTLLGDTVTVSVSDEGVAIVAPSETTAAVVTADVKACEAIVHVIDTVLTPAP